MVFAELCVKNEHLVLFVMVGSHSQSPLMVRMGRGLLIWVLAYIDLASLRSALCLERQPLKLAHSHSCKCEGKFLKVKPHTLMLLLAMFKRQSSLC